MSFFVFMHVAVKSRHIFSCRGSKALKSKEVELYLCCNDNCFVCPRSESPTQAFLITILWLYRKFKALEDAGYCRDEIKSEISSTVLSYDNMCHMDGLLIAKKNLPLPYPYDEMWKRVGKVIDRLHLKNHVDPKCKRLYNPDDKLPQEFNTMACEQTFVWASRFKKVMCAMPSFYTELSNIETNTRKNVTSTPKYQFSRN